MSKTKNNSIFNIVMFLITGSLFIYGSIFQLMEKVSDDFDVAAVIGLVVGVGLILLSVWLWITRGQDKDREEYPDDPSLQ